jgi:hypothetical protein
MPLNDLQFLSQVRDKVHIEVVYFYALCEPYFVLELEDRYTRLTLLLVCEEGVVRDLMAPRIR